jgi:hypothetical protein
LVHNTESGSGEGKRTVPVFKITAGGTEENNENPLR